MNKKRIERRFTWLKMSFCLPGIAGCMMFSAVNAETELQDEDYWAPVEQTVVHPVWIQDRHTGESVLTYVEEPDYSLWNGQRITDYEEAIKVDASPALGVLTIEKLNINVPIYNGTDDFNLDRGAGRIKGMAKMDEDGNLGISGHRDGFFRTFKDIEVGDDIEIQTPRGVETYAVSSINIIPKEDTSPLAPSDEKMLTLITCYPFYYVGHAPKRMIVKAFPKQSVAE
jgi:sortase A